MFLKQLFQIYCLTLKIRSMKMNFFNRKALRLFFAGVLVVSTVFISCSKDDDADDQTYTTTGSASGSQMNPSTTSTATGTLSGTYDARTNLWQYTINWTNLSATAGLVQVYGPATAGVNASLLFPLVITTPGISGSASGSVTLTDQQEVILLGNNMYYTISSATYTGGEIRGQITASPN
jgi:hypothetical protein